MPTPPVSLPTGSDAEGFTGAQSGAQPLDRPGSVPDRATVFAAVARTEELLAGMLLGHAVLAAGAFAGAGHRRRSVGADPDRGVGGRAAAALPAVRHAAPAGAADLRPGSSASPRSASTCWAARTPACVLARQRDRAAAGAGRRWRPARPYSRRPPSPYLGRAADLLDTLVVVSVIPVACAVVGLYSAVGDISYSEARGASVSPRRDARRPPGA